MTMPLCHLHVYLQIEILECGGGPQGIGRSHEMQTVIADDDN